MARGIKFSLQREDTVAVFIYQETSSVSEVVRRLMPVDPTGGEA